MGCFFHFTTDIGLPSGKSLFQIQAERIMCAQKLAARAAKEGKIFFSCPIYSFIHLLLLLIVNDAGSVASVSIHWYIMTSPFTDEATRKFFESHKYFGLEANQV